VLDLIQRIYRRLSGMSRKAVDITLTVREREQLERWSRGHQTPRSLAERAQIILFCVAGPAQRCHPGTVGCAPGHLIGDEHTFVHAVHDFMKCLEADVLPQPNFRDGVKIQAVLEAVERSAKTGQWIKVGERSARGVKPNA